MKIINRKANHFLQYLQDEFYFRRKIKKLGIDAATYNKLKRFSKSARVATTIQLFGNNTIFSSPFWFLHSLDEIFIEEVYRFVSTKKSPVIIDCGANIGLSVIYFKRLFPAASITAIEADPVVFTSLEKNLISHHLADVKMLNAAVWTENTTLNFHSEGSVGGKIEKDMAAGGTVTSVPAMRLREMLTQKTDFLKMDIEGAEYAVLKDCVDLLPNVSNLFIEYHCMAEEEQKLDEILSWVRQAGFKYYIREAWNNMTYPFCNQLNDFFQMQLNIFCYRPN